MAKPAEVKKRARRLAQEGKIVDAIATLEQLAQGDNTDPYDLVALGDLCVRGGRSDEATDYYERAVHAYRDAHLNRNAIALCRKVLRTHPGESRFKFLWAQMSEREGLTLDAVEGYLEYAQSLDETRPPRDLSWLDALARLTPKNVETLTRQAELLVLWGRPTQAVALLRSGASTASGLADRNALTELAQSISDLKAAAKAERAVAEGNPNGSESTMPRESFDEAYLRDLDFGPEESPPPDVPETDLGIAEESLVERLHSPPSADDTEDASAPELEAISIPGDDDSGGEDVYEIPVEDVGSVDEIEFDEPEPAPTEDPIDTERKLFQLAVQRDPDNVETLEKLLEVFLRGGDSLSATDLRERLAHALLMKGDSNGALAHYAAILEADPMRQDIQTRHDRLASELGLSADAAADVAPSASPKPGSLFNVKGLSKVEVKDDAEVSEDDMVDLDSLLDEFRAGLEEGMSGASPQAHYDLGLSHMEMGLFEEATQSFERATADPSMVSEAREMWGRCLRELDRGEEAAQVLRVGLAQQPGSLGIRYQLARALELVGDVEDARALYASILREDSDFEDAPQRLAALGDSDCPPQARTA